MKNDRQNLAVRMTAEQYDLLQRYMTLTNHRITIYFRHLITGYQLKARSLDIVRPYFLSILGILPLK